MSNCLRAVWRSSSSRPQRSRWWSTLFQRGEVWRRISSDSENRRVKSAHFVRCLHSPRAAPDDITKARRLAEKKKGNMSKYGRYSWHAVRGNDLIPSQHLIPVMAATINRRSGGARPARGLVTQPETVAIKNHVTSHKCHFRSSLLSTGCKQGVSLR